MGLLLCVQLLVRSFARRAENLPCPTSQRPLMRRPAARHAEALTDLLCARVLAPSHWSTGEDPPRAAKRGGRCSTRASKRSLPCPEAN
jgi:hypothetical protein